MRNNIGVILGLLGVFIIALGSIIGAFMLHWILGLITTGITLLVFACILIKDDDENYFWED